MHAFSPVGLPFLSLIHRPLRQQRKRLLLPPHHLTAKSSELLPLPLGGWGGGDRTVLVLITCRIPSNLYSIANLE